MERSLQSSTTSSYSQGYSIPHGTIKPEVTPISNPFPILPKKSSDPIFKESNVYQLKNNCHVEIVKNVKQTLSQHPYLAENLLDELKLIILKAFEVDIKNGEIFVKGKRFSDLFDHADYLGIVKKDKKIIGFHTGKKITDNLYYAIATMIDPEYQSNGAGLTTIMIIFDMLSKQSHDSTVKIVTRTRNYMVARMIESTCTSFSISTEKSKSELYNNVFEQTAKVLDHPYNTKTGIIKEVYPSGVPGGHQPPKDRICDAFKVLGNKDACYIAGESNMRKVSVLLKRCVKEYE